MQISNSKFLAKMTSFAISEVSEYSASVGDKVTLLLAFNFQEIGAPQNYKTN
jgi:hypothetical protein